MIGPSAGRNGRILSSGLGSDVAPCELALNVVICPARIACQGDAVDDQPL